MTEAAAERQRTEAAAERQMTEAAAERQRLHLLPRAAPTAAVCSALQYPLYSLPFVHSPLRPNLCAPHLCTSRLCSYCPGSYHSLSFYIIFSLSKEK
jgi:hypothetical protein